MVWCPLTPTGSEEAAPTVHPALAQVFAALDGAGISWCLLRGEARPADPTGDIDLLVAESDLTSLHSVPARCALRRVHAWSTGAHRLYLGRDAATGRFFPLDVAWGVECGPSGSFVLNWLRRPCARTSRPSCRRGAAGSAS